MSSGFRRFGSLFIAFIFVFGILTAMLPATSAATVTKRERSYEIAVVFDNSGSMYDDESWCRAKYAIEIFAAMLNYENGDKLRIYPMWEVTTDGSKPSSGGSYDAIEISSKEDIDKISKMYTVNANGTPFAPVTEASEYLSGSGATDKWIIVLTDGEFNMLSREDALNMSGDDLRTRLIDAAKNGIKVQYLGFGNAAQLSEDPASGLYVKNSSAQSLKNDLISICNAIFSRSALPNNKLSGSSLRLDLSMKSLIVFVQGQDAKITSLKSSSGDEISVTLDSGQRRYSEYKAYGEEDAPVDNTLAGQVVTFGGCKKGDYTLNISNVDADDVQIFYEPDVDIAVTLANSDGVEVDASSGQLGAGTYTLTSRLVDSKTGEDVTSHELLGGKTSLITKVKPSSSSDYTEYENGAQITFAPDSSTDIMIEGEYLDEYTITSEDSSSLDWLKGLNVSTDNSAFKIESQVLQSQSWYKISEFESWQPVRVKLTFKNAPLTDEQLSKVKLEVSPSRPLEYEIKPVQGESAIDVYIARNESGYVKPETGRYTFDISASFTDEIGVDYSASDDASFEIQTYSKIWRWLFWIALIGALLVLIALIRNTPAMPARMYIKFDIRNMSGAYSISTRTNTLDISTSQFPRQLLCSVKPGSPRKHRRTKRAKVKVKNVTVNPQIEWFEMDGVRFRQRSGKCYDDNDNPVDKANITIRDGTTVRWPRPRHDGGGIVSGTIYMNNMG